MTRRQPPEDRRDRLRFDGSRMHVALRPRGRLGVVTAQAVDFNRHGIAVQTDAPLDKDRVVFLNLRCDQVRLDNVVGVIHNCVQRGPGFRCGIRFRPTSELQHDRTEVQAMLVELEAALAAPAQRADPARRPRDEAG